MKFTKKEEETINRYFHISVFIKGFISLAEIVVGILAIFVPVSYVTNIVIYFAQGELNEDAGGFIASHIITLAQELGTISGIFIAVYLLSRGLIKVLLIVGMLKNKLWAYPSSLVVLAMFVLYQLYQIVTTHSWLLVGLTIFDLIVMWFIWKEYEVLRFEEEKSSK
jgi:uncharacterized membrane protein